MTRTDETRRSLAPRRCRNSYLKVSVCLGSPLAGCAAGAARLSFYVFRFGLLCISLLFLYVLLFVFAVILRTGRARAECRMGKLYLDARAPASAPSTRLWTDRRRKEESIYGLLTRVCRVPWCTVLRSV